MPEQNAPNIRQANSTYESPATVGWNGEKPRLISRAPAPLLSIFGARAVPSAKAETDRPSPETHRKILEARSEFEKSAFECDQAIRRRLNRNLAQDWEHV